MVFGNKGRGRIPAAMGWFGLLLLLLNLAVGTVAFPAEARAENAQSNAPQPERSGTPDWLAGDEQVDFSLTLALANPLEAESFTGSLYNPASSNFRHFVTPEQFMQQFGPGVEAEQAVNRWLTGWGLENVTPTQTVLSSPVRLWRGPAAQVERAFGVRLARYQENGENFVANDRAPTLPPEVSGYVAGVQLDNQPLFSHAQLSAAGSFGGAFTPAETRKIYNIQPFADSGLQGQGQTIAVPEFTLFNPADIEAYAGEFGLGSVDLETIQLGSDSAIGLRGAAEGALDIEMGVGIAPRAKVLAYQAPNNGNGSLALYSRLVSDNLASVVSISWGSCEALTGKNLANAMHQLFLQGQAQGMTFFASSGDTGAYDCNDRTNLGNNQELSVDYPASDPVVIGVGGTRVSLDNGNYAGETAWSNPRDRSRSLIGSGSGGGASAFFGRPAWQNVAGTSGNQRQVPDVAINADPATGYAVYCTVAPSCSRAQPWVIAGGTSAAAPLWAASALLVNQYVGGRVVNAPKLYELYAHQQPAPVFHDVTSGDNLYYKATPGYDMTTGLGSADFYSLAQDLAAPTTSTLFAETAFFNVWFGTDKPVMDGATSRTWQWGPQPFFNVVEEYAQAPNGRRLVQYFDKSRMEITNPGGDRGSIWYVTNGLLASEMMRGQIQIGDSQFRPKESAQIGVAGDPDDTFGPTYAAMGQVMNAPALDVGATVTATLDRAGNAGQNPAAGGFGVTAVFYVPETRHTIAKPFWDFLNSSGLTYDGNGKPVNGALFSPTFYATGFPLTEAYWARVKVAGQVKDVLVQAFERRVLTYTPGNPAGFQVEMGNVGRHYYTWRYQS